jgi:hypothetical protein
MTLRAFTSGYDLFHPHETIIWHDYGRPTAAKHWSDHTKDNSVTRGWHEMDSYSKNKVRRLLTGQPVDTYGLGMVRSLEEYEAYTGISLKLRKVQDYTVRCEEPPNPEAGSDWMGQIFTWMVRITLDRAALPVSALEDCSFWYVGVCGEDGNEIYRQDIPQSQLAALPSNEPTVVLICEFESGTIPASWTVWPVSDSLGWLAKLEGRLADGDYTIIMDDDV